MLFHMFLYVDITAQSWNTIERWIFDSYQLVQGMKMREKATLS